jgi:hypothetical protein
MYGVACFHRGLPPHVKRAGCLGRASFLDLVNDNRGMTLRIRWE